MLNRFDAYSPSFRERARFEHEISALQIFSDRHVAAPAKVANPTLGFEFDLNYGLNVGVFEALRSRMPAGSTFPIEYAEKVTSHQGRTSAGVLADGFEVTRDGPRLEISTKAFPISSGAEFAQIVKNVMAFGKELQAARKVRDETISVTLDIDGRLVPIAGHPTRFEHPKTVIDKLPLIIHEVGKEDALRFPPNRALTASPQATIALPLARIGDLIREIVNSRVKKVKKDDFPLTGPSTERLGLNMTLAVEARARAVASTRKNIGTMLLDGTTLTKDDFSKAFTGFLTLVVMYLLIGVFVDPRDEKEKFAKGRLPLNLKTPFWEVYKFCLTERERVIFRQLYANPDVRPKLYRLAQKGAKAVAGTDELFPEIVQWDVDRIHASKLTRDVFIDHILSGLPLRVTKDNNLPKPGNKLGDEILVAPLSSKIMFSKTDPLIAIELRRIGFRAFPLDQWSTLMEQLRDMARRLNA